MQKIKEYLTIIAITKADRFCEFRKKCKEYLGEYAINNDKFTIVDHDSYIGYLTEFCISEYIKDKYSADGFTVESWEKNYDVNKLLEIVYSDDKSEDSFEYVKNYFYDKYDLKISYRGKNVFIDVKTALTQKDPQDNWCFMYPVVQARKPGKDYMVLTYYVTYDNNPKSKVKEIYIAGYTSEMAIRNKKIIYKGQLNRFHVVSQTDNYETILNIDYKNIDDLFDLIKHEMEDK